MDSQNINIRKNVLEKIASNEVKMKSRLHFIVKLSLFILVLLLVLIISSLLISYILFTLKISGQFFLLGFGLKGLQAFILLFPWIFLLIDCVLIIILDWLLNRFSFAYHRPLLFLSMSTLVVIIAVGCAINLTSFHSNLLKMNQDKQLLFLGDLYNGLNDLQKEDGIFTGTIIEINGDTFIVKHNDFDADGDRGLEKVTIVGVMDVSKVVRVGEGVFIAGERVDDTVRAYGVREILLIR